MPAREAVVGAASEQCASGQCASGQCASGQCASGQCARTAFGDSGSLEEAATVDARRQ